MGTFYRPFFRYWMLDAGYSIRPPARGNHVDWDYRVSSIEHQKVFARYELSTTVIELSGMSMAARSGLIWPVIAKVTATRL